MLAQIVLSLLVSASGYVLPARPAAVAVSRAAAPKALMSPDMLPLTLLAEITDATGERVYGAVEAVRPRAPPRRSCLRPAHGPSTSALALASLSPPSPAAYRLHSPCGSCPSAASSLSAPPSCPSC